MRNLWLRISRQPLANLWHMRRSTQRILVLIPLNTQHRFNIPVLYLKLLKALAHSSSNNNKKYIRCLHRWELIQNPVAHHVQTPIVISVLSPVAATGNLLSLIPRHCRVNVLPLSRLQQHHQRWGAKSGRIYRAIGTETAADLRSVKKIQPTASLLRITRLDRLLSS